MNIFIHTGYAKVSQFNRPVATYQYILWLHITMNDISTMSSAKTKRNIMGNDNRAVDIKHSTRMEIAAQVCAIDQLHDNIIIAIGLSIVVDLYNIGVLQG